MGTLHSIAYIVVATAWLLPETANAIGRISLSNDQGAAAAIVSSDRAHVFLASLSTLLTRDPAAARNHPSDEGSPCPSGHNWDSADVAKESAPRKADKINAKSRSAIATEMVTAQKATRRTSVLAGESTPRTPKSASSKSATKAAISCTEGCRAELAACQMPGSKKGKTNCKSMYGSCMQGC